VLLFHGVGVGWDGRLLMLLLCGELRSRTGMMGRRTSLLTTERGGAALGALDGTYLVCRFEVGGFRNVQCAQRASEGGFWEWRFTRATLFVAWLRGIETGLVQARWLISLRTY